MNGMATLSAAYGEKFNMNHELYDRAEILANQNYSVTIETDTLSDGRPVYVASNPELPGCMGQGATTDEAVNDLKAARVEYIATLLTNGLPIPKPART